MSMVIVKKQAAVAVLKVALIFEFAITFWLFFVESLWPIINDDPITNGQKGAFFTQAIITLAIGVALIYLTQAYSFSKRLDLESAQRAAHIKSGLPLPKKWQTSPPAQLKKTPAQSQEERMAALEDELEELKAKGGEK